MDSTLLDHHSSSNRTGYLVYGILCYAIGMAGLVALIAACLGLLPLGAGWVNLEATGAKLALNLGLIALFGIQHAIMARPAYKQRWREHRHQATERPTFVLLSGVILGLVVLLWQPVGGVLWSVDSTAGRAALIGLASLGWIYMLVSSFAIDHFELFGLRQSWQASRGIEIDRPEFRRRLTYRFDRHPIMTGILIGLWSTPDMGHARLTLAAALTVYIILGVRMEERDLKAEHGKSYELYRQEVRSMVPGL